MSQKAKKPLSEPIFFRSDVAKILNVTELTIANREKRGKYPEPTRDVNNYRYYTIDDVFDLQLLTFQKIDTKPIVSILFDKGYNDPSAISRIVKSALERRTGSIITPKK